MKALFASFVLATAVWAEAETVPPLINYQGRLANADGTPFATADYSLSVRLFDAGIGGAMIWGPQEFDGAVGPGHGARVPVAQGYFNLVLGPVDTQGRSLGSAFAVSNRFVEVTVSNRPPILPRQQQFAHESKSQCAHSHGQCSSFGLVDLDRHR